MAPSDDFSRRRLIFPTEENLRSVTMLAGVKRPCSMAASIVNAPREVIGMGYSRAEPPSFLERRICDAHATLVGHYPHSISGAIRS